MRGLLEGHQAAPVRPCLLYAHDGIGAPARRFYMCPEATAALRHESELWQAVEGGFSGTIFIPASLGHGLDLERLCAYPDVHVIILPD
ncbi:hypothetical protein DSECCO2_532500 [anaerobic digester metagenome]